MASGTALGVVTVFVERITAYNTLLPPFQIIWRFGFSRPFFCYVFRYIFMSGYLTKRMYLQKSKGQVILNGGGISILACKC
jgi:hypothetical protein